MSSASHCKNAREKSLPKLIPTESMIIKWIKISQTHRQNFFLLWDLARPWVVLPWLEINTSSLPRGYFFSRRFWELGCPSWEHCFCVGNPRARAPEPCLKKRTSGGCKGGGHPYSGLQCIVMCVCVWWVWAWAIAQWDAMCRLLYE